MTDSQDRWNKAYGRLIDIAEARKEARIAPWNDPDVIKKLADEASKEVETSHADEPSEVRGEMLAFTMYDKLIMLFADQTDELDQAGKVNDSVGDYALLMLRFEEFFIATISFIDAKIDAILDLMDKEEDALSETYADYIKQIDTLKDVTTKMAEGFLSLLKEMRRRHDILISITYQTKM